MSKDQDEFGNYLATALSINRKILTILFDLEVESNKNIQKELEYIKNNPDQNLFFFEDNLDFKSLIKILTSYNSKDKLFVLINYNIDNNVNDEKIIFKHFLQKSIELRNDIWHNNIVYYNPKKYYNIINIIKSAYEMFQKNQAINKSDLFEKCIKYLDICLNFFGSYKNNNSEI